MVRGVNTADTAKVYKSNGQTRVHLPMTQATGKIRLKARTFFGEYGLPVASRTTVLSQTCYAEWQIGYDLEKNSENMSKTSLVDYSFVNYKGTTKLAYELSEILFYSYEDGLVSREDIKTAYSYIKSLKKEKLLDVIDEMRIARTNPVETIINDFPFYSMKVSYPLIVHKFGKYDIYTEITNKEKQRAVGVQPMLYVCIPLTSLVFQQNPIGRTLQSKESADWIIGKDEAKLSLELFMMFGMLSEKHQFDVLRIMETLFDL